MTGQNISLPLRLHLCLYLFIHNFPIKNLFGSDCFFMRISVHLAVESISDFHFQKSSFSLFKLAIQFTLTKLLNLEELVIFT